MSSTVLGIVLVVAASLITAVVFYPDALIGAKARPDLPGPTGIPVLGNLVQIFPHRKRMLYYLSVLEQRYGELFTFATPGTGRNIVINRPEWVEHIKKHDGVGYGKGDTVLAMFREFPGPGSALASEGAQWKLARKIMRPLFSSNSVDLHAFHAMSKIIPIAKNMLLSASRGDLKIDFNDFCGKLTLVILCEIALNMETNILTSDPSCLTTTHELVDDVSTLNHISAGRIYNPFWRITEIFDGTRKVFNDSRSRIHDLLDKLIQDKQKELSMAPPSVRDGDFLSTLLRDSNIEDPTLLRDTLLNVMFAGHDTTQNVLVWSLYELSRNPKWIHSMRGEALAQKNSVDEIPAYDELSEYPIHLAVFYETLRLWPGVPKNARIALRDDVLPAVPGYHGGMPVAVSKGDYVTWSDYSIMRNEKIWGSDAQMFNPARHLDSSGKLMKPTPPKFHAFGAGPRLCPGAQLATYEFVAIWAGFLPVFDFSPVEDKDRHPADSLTMSMDGPFMITISARD